ncbi:MAG: FAD-dependent thymidylate synthase [Muribaculum sp.]|nr:FAD-dependent thymidylate synthase [Muribaculum sp.]MCM1235137.1 FAD-dependent thymidylate synthase [Ruminococcus flavefaciens]
MKAEVKKLTDVSLLQRANGFTTGHDSHMTLETAYRYGHSPIRTQMFWVELTDIPLFVASQLVRSHVGVQFFQRSKRIDRGGADFALECTEIAQQIDDGITTPDIDRLSVAEARVNMLPKYFDRYAPTDIAFICNAEALINMAHKRLCAKASKETRDVMTQIALGVAIADPALAPHLVPQCVFRGGICSEPKSCQWINSGVGQTVLTDYLELFTNSEK